MGLTVIDFSQCVVDFYAGFQLCEWFIQDLPCEIGQSGGVLGKATACIATQTIPARYLHVAVAHPVVRGNDAYELSPVCPTCGFEHIIHLVHERDLGGQETVDTIFYHRSSHDVGVEYWTGFADTVFFIELFYPIGVCSISTEQ